MVNSDDRIEALERDTAKTEFFDLMKRQGYDMYDLDEESRLPKCLIPIIEKKDLNSFIMFNSTLGYIHRKHGVSVIDMCKYLIEDFFDEQQLLTLLQTNLYDALYLELQKKNRMSTERTSKFLIK